MQERLPGTGNLWQGSEAEVEACIGAVRQGVIPMTVLTRHINIAIACLDVHGFDDLQPHARVGFHIVLNAA